MFRSFETIKAYLEPVWQLSAPNIWLHFHQARIEEKREEGGGIYSLRLRPAIKMRLNFTAGQHVELCVEIDGKRLSRVFTISSSPAQLVKNGWIELSIKRQKAGLVTNWIPSHLTPGNVVHISKPRGNFCFHNPEHAAKTLMLAAGSGITPFMSMLEQLKTTQLEQCILLYWIRDEQDMPFQERLNQLQEKGLAIHVFASSKAGRISSGQIKSFIEANTINQAYTCGPADFNETAAHIIEQKLVGPQGKSIPVYSERFGLTLQRTESDEHVTWIRQDKTQHNSETTRGTLLETAEEQGLSPLYGCRAGICHQCTAKKHHGRVQNVLTGEISDQGEEEVQLCITKPKTAVTIEIRERYTQ